MDQLVSKPCMIILNFNNFMVSHNKLCNDASESTNTTRSDQFVRMLMLQLSALELVSCYTSSKSKLGRAV